MTWHGLFAETLPIQPSHVCIISSLSITKTSFTSISRLCLVAFLGGKGLSLQLSGWARSRNWSQRHAFSIYTCARMYMHKQTRGHLTHAKKYALPKRLISTQTNLNLEERLLHYHRNERQSGANTVTHKTRQILHLEYNFTGERCEK